MTQKDKKMTNKWIATRKGEICGIFKNRKEAVKWLKGILTQTLKDFETQDKTDEYDYGFDFPSYSIKEVVQRKEYLGL